MFVKLCTPSYSKSTFRKVSHPYKIHSSKPCLGLSASSFQDFPYDLWPSLSGISRPGFEVSMLDATMWDMSLFLFKKLMKLLVQVDFHNFIPSFFFLGGTVLYDIPGGWISLAATSTGNRSKVWFPSRPLNWWLNQLKSMARFLGSFSQVVSTYLG